MISTGWFLLGAPWDCSGSGRGEQDAPDALRAAGLSAQVDKDLGDAATKITSTHRDADTGVLALPDTVRAARTLTDRLAAALVDLPGQRPLVVGGDCSILLGIVPALRARGLVSLWFFDGHPDFLDGAASETGEAADMELAVLTGSGAAPLVQLAGPAPMTPMVPVERVVLLGHRAEDLDDASAAELARLPPVLRRIDASSLVTDPATSGERAARWLEQVDPVGQGTWLHLDLDVLDPDVLPAVTYPQSGGQTGSSSRWRSLHSPTRQTCSASASPTFEQTSIPPAPWQPASWRSLLAFCADPATQSPGRPCVDRGSTTATPSGSRRGPSACSAGGEVTGWRRR